MLRDVKLTAIYSSEFTRTRGTAQPVANAKGVPITEVPGADSAKLTKLVAAQKGKTVLVVGHTNTVPALIKSLGGPPVIIDESEYDKFFVLTVHAPGKAALVTLRYGQTTAVAHSPTAQGTISRMVFRRSGGIAANLPLMANVIAELEIQPDGTASLSSPRRPAAAPVSSDEVRRLLSGLDIQAFTTAHTVRQRTARDEYRYTLTVHHDDGRSHSVEFGDSDRAEVTGRIPGLDALIQWFQTRTR